MTAELHWGLPVIGYLFLAGVGAGALTVSASVLLRGGGGGFAGRHFELARYGALIAPLPVIVGTGLLVLELGSFKYGWANFDIEKIFRFRNLFRTINLSPMSIGSWLLLVFIAASLVYAYTFWSKDAAPGDRFASLRRGLAWVCVPLGIAVGVYTGVLLGAMPARPFWNSPMLALLFLVSSISTGVAVIILARSLFGTKAAPSGADAEQDESGYLLAASDALLIGFEVVVIFLFLMFAHLTVGAVKVATSVILGGSLTSLFWLGVVVVGLLIPVLIELYYVIPKLLYHHRYEASRLAEIAGPVTVLIGGFVLRYVVVVAGQITGPVGF